MTSANYNELKWGLEELSSKQEQLRLWRAGSESNEVSSLGEVTCSVFNYDVDRILGNEQASFSLPAETISLLKELRYRLKLVPKDVSPTEQIEHHEMLEVRRLASTLLKQLNTASALSLDTP